MKRTVPSVRRECRIRPKWNRSVPDSGWPNSRTGRFRPIPNTRFRTRIRRFRGFVPRYRDFRAAGTWRRHRAWKFRKPERRGTLRTWRLRGKPPSRNTRIPTSLGIRREARRLLRTPKGILQRNAGFFQFPPTGKGVPRRLRRLRFQHAILRREWANGKFATRLRKNRHRKNILRRARRKRRT